MLSRFKYFILRTFSEKGRYQLLWAVVIVCAIIGVSMVVFNLAFPDYSLLENFWQSLSCMLTPVPLRDIIVKDSDGKLALTIVYLLGLIAFSGTLIAIFSAVLRTVAEKYKNGQFTFAFKNHYVVMGSSSLVEEIVLQLRQLHPKNDVVVLTSYDVPSLRNRFAMSLSKKDLRKIIFVQGRRDAKQDLMRVRICNAIDVYVIDEVNEVLSDVISINTVKMMSEIAEESQLEKKISCHVSFKADTTSTIFFFADLDEKAKKYIEFMPFVVKESIARQVLVDNKYGEFTYEPLDRGGISQDSDSFVHFVIVGMTRMGRSMAKMAALTAHYPNFEKRKTRITFVDAQAHKKMQEFMTSNYHLFDLSNYSYCEVVNNQIQEVERHVPTNDVMDIEWQFIQSEVEDSAMRNQFEKWSVEKDALLTIAVCIDDSDRNIFVGMFLPRKLFEEKIPVYVYQRNSGKLLEIANSSKIYSTLKPFGMDRGCYSLNRDRVMTAARMINYIYWRGKSAQEYPDAEVTEKWKLAAVSDKWSNFYNALHIKTKLRSLGIRSSKINTEQALDMLLQNLVHLGKVEHNRWVAEKLLLGFRPLTDEEKKDVDYNFDNKKRYKKELFAHYDIRSLKELPEDVQFYDILLIRNILQIATESQLLD